MYVTRNFSPQARSRDPSAMFFYVCFQGFSSLTLSPRTSPVSRVTSVSECTMAVAASSVSTTGLGRCADNSPHKRAVAASMPRIRSEKLCSNPSTQTESNLAETGSDCIFIATPLRNSPRVRTLMYIAVDSAAARKLITPASACRRRVSDKTFVSSRYCGRALTNGRACPYRGYV